MQEGWCSLLLRDTLENLFLRGWLLSGPVALVVFWVAAVLIAWAAAGRQIALVSWIILLGLICIAISVVTLLYAISALHKLRKRHQRFEHAGEADVAFLSRSERRIFSALHLGMSGLIFLTGGGIAFALLGLPSSAFALGFLFIPSVILAWKSFAPNLGPHCAIGLSVRPIPQLTRNGRDALFKLDKRERLRQSLVAAHQVGPQATTARELLAILRHPMALWPDLNNAVAIAPIYQLRWRAAALFGLLGHMISAAVLAWALAMWLPVNLFPPLPSPLALLNGADPVVETPEPNRDEELPGSSGDGSAEDQPSGDERGDRSSQAGDESAGEDAGPGEGSSGNSDAGGQRAPSDNGVSENAGVSGSGGDSAVGDDGDSSGDAQSEPSAGEGGNGEGAGESGADESAGASSVGESAAGGEAAGQGVDSEGKDEASEGAAEGQEGERQEGEAAGEGGEGAGAGGGAGEPNDPTGDGTGETSGEGEGGETGAPPDENASDSSEGDATDADSSSDAGEGEGAGGAAETGNPIEQSSNGTSNDPLAVDLSEPQDGSGATATDDPIPDGTETQQVNVAGSGSELPDDQTGPIIGPPPTDADGEVQDITTGTAAAGDSGQAATETDQTGATHPFAAQGEAPPGVTIFQEELPPLPDNLPPAPPPAQSLPSWILELENVQN